MSLEDYELQTATGVLGLGLDEHPREGYPAHMMV